jgi:hypothetical protein
MPRTGKVRTWTVVAALTMAVLYGSFCSTACAVAALPVGAASSHCDKCDRARRSDSSRQNQSPSDRNCGRHVHPTYFVQASGAPTVHFEAAAASNTLALLVNRLYAADFIAASLGPGLGPPGSAKTPLPEKLSVLRI